MTDASGVVKWNDPIEDEPESLFPMLHIPTDWGLLATGASGDLELEQRWLRVAQEVYELYCSKAASYGPGNIAAMGDRGVALRVSDKIERLKNVYFEGGQEVLVERCPHCNGEIGSETLKDTWLDLADYGIIGELCRRGDWPGGKDERQK